MFHLDFLIERFPQSGLLIAYRRLEWFKTMFRYFRLQKCSVIERFYCTYYFCIDFCIILTTFNEISNVFCKINVVAWTKCIIFWIKLKTTNIKLSKHKSFDKRWICDWWVHHYWLPDDVLMIFRIFLGML